MILDIQWYLLYLFDSFNETDLSHWVPFLLQNNSQMIDLPIQTIHMQIYPLYFNIHHILLTRWGEKQNIYTSSVPFYNRAIMGLLNTWPYILQMWSVNFSILVHSAAFQLELIPIVGNEDRPGPGIPKYINTLNINKEWTNDHHQCLQQLLHTNINNA